MEKDALEAGRLRAAYNAASGVIAGLDALKGKPDSKLEYSIKEQGVGLSISTNIPTETQIGLTNTLKILVEPDGQMTAFGDEQRDKNQRQIVETVYAKNGEAAPILTFVTQKASLKGLLKPS